METFPCQFNNWKKNNSIEVAVVEVLQKSLLFKAFKISFKKETGICLGDFCIRYTRNCTTITDIIAKYAQLKYIYVVYLLKLNQA